MICATQAGTETVLIVSEYNAARIFGLLAIFLGIQLSKKVGKAIILADARFSGPLPEDA